MAIFVILAKSQKLPKIHFFFTKVEIFFAHLNHLGRQFFVFSILFDSIKKMGKNEKNTLLHSNFGQKRFSILLTNTYIWTCLSHFAEKGTIPGPPNGGALGMVLKLSKIRCATRASRADLIIINEINSKYIWMIQRLKD